MQYERQEVSVQMNIDQSKLTIETDIENKMGECWKECCQTYRNKIKKKKISEQMFVG